MKWCCAGTGCNERATYAEPGALKATVCENHAGHDYENVIKACYARDSKSQERTKQRLTHQVLSAWFNFPSFKLQREPHHFKFKQPSCPSFQVMDMLRLVPGGVIAFWREVKSRPLLVARQLLTQENASQGPCHNTDKGLAVPNPKPNPKPNPNP